MSKNPEDIQPLRNNDQTNQQPEKWDYEKIFEYKCFGHFGYQQRIYILFLAVCAFLCGFNAILPTFLMSMNGNPANPNFVNNTTNCQNYTDYIDLQTGKPLDENNDGGFLEMKRTKYLDESVVDYFNLICDRSSLIELADSVYFAGQIFASLLAGYLGDNYGRKLPVLLSMILCAGATLLSGFTESWTVYVVCRFFISFVMVSGLNAYVMIMELAGPSVREQLGVATQVSFAFGCCVCSFVAYYASTWRELLYMAAVMNLAPLVIQIFCPESPRYLLLRGKIDQVKKIILGIAEKNNAKSGSKNINDVKELEKYMDLWEPDNSNSNANQQTSDEKIYTFFDLFNHSLTMSISVFKNMFLWGTVSLVFYGVSLNVNRMPGDLYITNIISGLAEAISCSTLAPYIVTRYPFRKTLGYSFLMGGIALFATYLILCYPEMDPFSEIDGQKWVLVTITSFFGKFFIATVFAIIYNYTANAFPTSVRANAISLSSAAARMGSTIRPLLSILAGWFLVNLGMENTLMLMYMGLSVLSYLVCMTLIEVFQKPMIMTFDDFDKRA